jgi:hypothetical protein
MGANLKFAIAQGFYPPGDKLFNFKTVFPEDLNTASLLLF